MKHGKKSRQNKQIDQLTEVQSVRELEKARVTK